MKNTLLLFIFISSTLFSIGRFDRLNWGDSVFQVKLEYSTAQESKPNSNTTVLSVSHPEDYVERYSFYFKNDKLYQIELKYKNGVSFEELENIYSELVQFYGIPESKVIDYSDGDFYFTGNEKIWHQKDSIVTLKGLDRYNSNEELLTSELYLIHQYLPATSNKNN